MPAHTAGVTFFMGKDPLRILARVDITAAGRKNRRLIPRALAGSTPIMAVSHKISRLPPPRPIPASVPHTAAAKKAVPKLMAINTGYLPI